MPSAKFNSTSSKYISKQAKQEVSCTVIFPLKRKGELYGFNNTNVL